MDGGTRQTAARVHGEARQGKELAEKLARLKELYPEVEAEL